MAVITALKALGEAGKAKGEAFKALSLDDKMKAVMGIFGAATTRLPKE